MTDTLLVAARFRGPANAGNGGYVAGRLAGFLGDDGPVEVSLRAPTPLDTPLTVERTDGEVRLLHGTQLIAAARPQPLALDVPAPPSAAAAEAASGAGGSTAGQPYSHCFVCGRARPLGEGLNVFPGWLPDRSMVATLWRPDAAFAAADGSLPPEYVWGALDCPGGFAASDGPQGPSYLTARLHVALHAPVRAEKPHIVVGWPIRREGRKVLSGTAVYGEDGTVLARALSLWIAPRAAA